MKLSCGHVQDARAYELAVRFPKLGCTSSISIPSDLSHFLWSDTDETGRFQIHLFSLIYSKLDNGDAIGLIILPVFFAFAWGAHRYDTFDKLYAERNRRIFMMKKQGIVDENTWTGKKLRQLPRKVRKMERWYRRNHRRLMRRERRQRDAKIRG